MHQSSKLNHEGLSPSRPTLEIKICRNRDSMTVSIDGEHDVEDLVYNFLSMAQALDFTEEEIMKTLKTVCND
jgi:hypothetical protein